MWCISEKPTIVLRNNPARHLIAQTRVERKKTAPGQVLGLALGHPVAARVKGQDHAHRRDYAEDKIQGRGDLKLVPVHALGVVGEDLAHDDARDNREDHDNAGDCVHRFGGVSVFTAGASAFQSDAAVLALP